MLRTWSRPQVTPRLLVSVATPREAAAALAGGSDIVDAKDPARGALGPVPLAAFGAIAAVVGRACPLSAALGDADDERTVEAAARDYAAAGARAVKVGFAGLRSAARVARLARAAARGASSHGAELVAVAYADEAGPVIAPLDLIAIAAEAGAAGLLVDTADKRGPSLPRLVPLATLGAWAGAAHGHGLWFSLAGRLAVSDFDALRAVDADVVGVRGAACDGGRTGEVSAIRVRLLRERLHRPGARATA